MIHPLPPTVSSAEDQDGFFFSRNFQLSGARQCGERWSPDRSFSFHACSSFMQWKFNRRTSVKEIPVVLTDKLLILEGEIGR